MSPISIFICLIAPIVGHRLVVGPPPAPVPVVGDEYDSVIVSSDPIKITEGKGNSIDRSDTAREPDYAIRLNGNGADPGVVDTRSGKNCKYNDISCLYGTEPPKVDSDKSDHQEIIDRFLEQYSSIANAKFGPEQPMDNRTDNLEEKAYYNTDRPSYHQHHQNNNNNNPYDDKKGWVTLETVPWSTSMVSKWQPNVQPTHPSPSSYDQPTSQSHRPTQHHHTQDRPWHYGGMSDPKPAATMATQSWTTHRPAPVTTNYGSYTPVASNYPQSKPSSQWGIGNNDIITDNRPTNFPGSGYHHQPPSTSHGHYQEAQHTMTTHQVARPTRYPSVTNHPSTYPDSGNGEWVLLSTTKGYSLPSGYRGPGKTIHDDSRPVKNPEISRYHEEDIEPAKVAARRKLDLDDTWDASRLRVLHTENGSSIYAAAKDRNGRSDWSMEESPLQILYTSADEKESKPSMTMRRTLRLQVLPPVNNETSLAHDGLIEVDPNYHGIGKNHKPIEEEKIKQLSKIANVRRSNLTLYRVIPAPVTGVTGKSMRDKSKAVLAAVGAGMIPATMAVLVPMALGRKKRSLPYALKPMYNTKKSFINW